MKDNKEMEIFNFRKDISCALIHEEQILAFNYSNLLILDLNELKLKIKRKFMPGVINCCKIKNFIFLVGETRISKFDESLN